MKENIMKTCLDDNGNVIGKKVRTSALLPYFNKKEFEKNITEDTEFSVLDAFALIIQAKKVDLAEKLLALHEIRSELPLEYVEELDKWICFQQRNYEIVSKLPNKDCIYLEVDFMGSLVHLKIESSFRVCTNRPSKIYVFDREKDKVLAVINRYNKKISSVYLKNEAKDYWNIEKIDAIDDLEIYKHKVRINIEYNIN